jgi:hypothetical protein
MYIELEGHTLGRNFRCPLCNNYAYRHNNGMIPSADMITCPACGKFRIDGMADLWLNGLKEPEKNGLYKISFALRSISERAIGKRDNSLFPIYSHDDLATMLSAAEPSVQEKLSLLLNFLGRTSQYPGQSVEFDSGSDYPIVCARNSHEARFYFHTLAEQHLILSLPPFTGSQNEQFTVTAAGWKELDRPEGTGVEPSSAFIAMSFHPDRDPFKGAISSAILDAGYRPVRVDQIEHVNRIDDEIIARIKSSKFLVSDFTSQRNGVYFEAGLMLGLGRPVIWLCEKDDLKNVHFDTRQYNTIDYSNAADLQKRLQVRIEAIMGKGPIEVSSNGMTSP